MEQIVAEEGRTYSDRGKNNTDGAKNNLGRCDARDLLRQIHGLDGRIQQ